MSETTPPDVRRTGARVIRLTEFEQVAGLFGRWQGRFEQISGGRFEGTLRVVSGRLVRVIGIEANQRVLIRGHDAAGLFSVYPVTPGNAADLWQGRRLAPGQLVVTGVQTEVDHYSARRTADLGASARPAVLEEAARSLLAADAVVLPAAWAAITPPPAAAADLTRRLAGLLDRGVADPSPLGTPDGDRLEQECVRALVAALFPAIDRRPDLPLPARSLVARRADEYLRARLAAPVGAVDLCRELGVSDRTLRLAFRERFGLGPMAYFKCLRLNAVRARLRGDAGETVAAAARAYGFHHLGNFAGDYRRLFGERPSDTARGDPGDPLPPPP